MSIGARGLSGTSYKGHVFWDTEIFMLPFFDLTYPEAARALLMYRFHTLSGARAKAARLGYRGALYAWESADTGEDVTPPFAVAPNGEIIRILTGELPSPRGAIGTRPETRASLSTPARRSLLRRPGSGRAEPSLKEMGTTTSAA